ncbi:unnamed protein product [Vitrella brassicaformis CCMP3155]|uniref:Apoptosis-antagonizing transcription factor C-terminal domain-containing protein n=2 Tax=Vitrella brassicaformis TaxID=1169539 RepID=A0A0G4F2U1_VITBC|nr:unnamed protein product [Vitrella brassicaformis CCMP3155]|eukprot:CEM05714.1 unnamed protein product [Vitrella brassicaformis CCMP3155]
MSVEAAFVDQDIEDDFAFADLDHTSAAARYRDLPKADEGRPGRGRVLELPERYRGQRVTRADLQKERDRQFAAPFDDEEDEESDDAPSEEGEEGDEQMDEEQDGGFPSVDLSGLHVSLDPSLEDKTRRIEASRQKEALQFVKQRRQTAEQEYTKAKHVQTQQGLWKEVVHCRVALQGILSQANQLPVGVREGRGNRVVRAMDCAALEVAEVLVGLLELQSKLAKLHPELHEALQVLNDGQEDGGPSNDSDAPKSLRKRQWSSSAAADERSLWCGEAGVERQAKRVRTWALHKADQWKKETTLQVSHSFKAFDQPLAVQLRHAEKDLDRLIARSRPAESAIKVLATSAADNDPSEAAHHIYDDQDFYVQLLRDIVQSRDVTSPFQHDSDDAPDRRELLNQLGASSSLAAKLKRRESAAKRKEVDRRASKGRKIRYVPIPKLANFMAPEPRRPPDGALYDAGFVDRIMNSLFQDTCKT